MHVSSLKIPLKTIAVSKFILSLPNIDTQLAYFDGILYIANNSNIHVIEIKDTLGKGETKKYENLTGL